MEDPFLAVTTDSFNNVCSAPVPLMGTTGDEPPDPPPAATWKDDIQRIADAHGVPMKNLLSCLRNRPTAHARFEVFARLRARGWSTPRIGLHVGGRDHTTVMYGLKRYAVLVREGKITPLIF